MYSVNEIDFTTENDETIKLYGIESEHYRYTSLSKCKEDVEKVCELCNRLDLSEEQLINIIEDMFLL